MKHLTLTSVDFDYIVEVSPPAAAEINTTGILLSYEELGFLLFLAAVLCLAITLLFAAVDRYRSACRETWALLELILRERTRTGTNVTTNDNVRPVFIEGAAESPTHSGPDHAGVENRPIAATTVSTARSRTFRLEIAETLLPKIHAYINQFLTKHGSENEAGGMFIGDCVVDAATQVVTFSIRGFIEAGPEADFGPGSIQFDTAYQDRALEALLAEHSGSANLGCFHRQPGSMDECSSGDLIADRQAVSASDTKALIFAIVTLNNPRVRASSVFYRDLKFDFYLMADETSFEYQPITPVLKALPEIEVSPTMMALHSLRGPELALDLRLLRQLPGLAQAKFQQLSAAAGVMLTAKFSDMAQLLRLWIQPNGALRLFRDQDDGHRQELSGLWTQSEAGRHIWLSQLLLHGRTILNTDTPVGYYRHFCLIDDKHRLVAEVRAMQERYGDRARLRRNGDSLYWEYTVHQNGRAFPIKVAYPDTYPADPPTIISLKSLPASPHTLGANQLCWTDAYTSYSEWNPARDTAVIAVNAAHRWFACLLIYQTTGQWPRGAED